MIIAALGVQNNYFQNLQVPEFVRKKFRFLFFIICLLGVTYLTAQFYKNDSWSILLFLMVIGLMTIGFLFAGISLYSCLFATIAFLPNINSFLPMGSFSLTWVEVCMGLCILFLLKRPLRLTKMALLSICLYLSCVVSLIGSPLGLLSAGLMLRFGILLMFINLLLLQPVDPKIFKSFFLGLLLIPLTACSSYAGEGVLADMFSANFLSLSRAVYSFQYPIWFAILVPFLIYTNAPRFLVILGTILVTILIILSFARSIILGTGISTILYLIYSKDRKPLKRFFTKSSIIILMAVVLYIVVFVLKFLEFNNMDNDSNAARYEKMPIAFNSFIQHPFFGAGFGASNDTALADKRSAEKVFQELISPEFGPLTALSEIGAVGTFFLFSMIYLCFIATIKLIKCNDVKFVYKLVVLISFGGLVSSFLNSNSLASITVYFFLFIPMFFHKNKNDQSILQKLQIEI